MALRKNSYEGFIEDLDVDLDLMVELERAITCFGMEGTCLENTIVENTIHGVVEIIPRGDSYLLVNKNSGNRVWVNKTSDSHKIFVKILQRAIQGIIDPHIDPESYWAHQYAVAKDD